VIGLPSVNSLNSENSLSGLVLETQADQCQMFRDSSDVRLALMGNEVLWNAGKELVRVATKLEVLKSHGQ